MWTTIVEIYALVATLVVCYDHWDKLEPLLVALRDKLRKKKA